MAQAGKGKFALYTDAGLVAYGISKTRAVAMAKRIKHGSAKVATTSGRVVQEFGAKKRNPAKSIRLRNFSGTVSQKPDGTVRIAGRGGKQA